MAAEEMPGWIRAMEAKAGAERMALARIVAYERQLERMLQEVKGSALVLSVKGTGASIQDADRYETRIARTRDELTVCEVEAQLAAKDQAGRLFLAEETAQAAAEHVAHQQEAQQKRSAERRGQWIADTHAARKGGRRE